MVVHIEPVGSDHNLLLLNGEYKFGKASRVFWFEAIWAEHADFISAVRRFWRRVWDVGEVGLKSLYSS